MQRLPRICFGVFVLATLHFPTKTVGQAPEAAAAKLREVHTDGMKTLSEPQVIALAQLESGSLVGKADLQAAADRLIQTGLFAKVNYNFQTRADGVNVAFHVQETRRIPVYFDNVPWFGDSELGDAIRKKLPFFDGTLPEAGAVLDLASQALTEFLASRELNVTVEHQVIANPLGEGSVQEFHIQGPALQIAKVEFADASLMSSKTIQQELAHLIGKPYSRMTIDLFLSEQVRPLYLQQGCLRAKLGPPEVRLSGNPNQKLSRQIPVFVPVAKGPIYHLKEIQWAGNSLLSTFTLNNDVGLKPGDVADGVKIEGGWDRATEDYGHRGYLEAKLNPVASYDDQAHTISYTVSVQEGTQYHMGAMVLTGISPADERRLREAWPIPEGEIFDKAVFEDFLTKLQTHPAQIFGDLPVHYETVGHWLRTDAGKATVDVLLDFK